MNILDSNIWIAYAYKEDTQHTKAVSLIESLTEDVYIPEYVVAEVCTVLQNKKRKVVANAFIESILKSNYIHILHSSVKMFNCVITLFYSRNKSRLSFVDTSLLYLSRTYTVLTFDIDLQKAINAHTKTSD